MSNERSLPGQGESVMIYVVDETVAGSIGAEDSLCANVQEDFAANCQWPVVVKVKLNVSDEALVRYLLYLASVVEARRSTRSTTGNV